MSNQHQLTRQRNNGQMATQQRMAAQAVSRGQIQQAAFNRHQMLQAQNIPQGPGGLDVAGCGPDFNQGGFPTTPNHPWNSAQGFIGLPQNAPMAPMGAMGLDWLRQQLYRLGIMVEAGVGSITVDVSPANGASLYVAGFLSRNDPFQIIIEEINQGSIPFSSVSDIDASVFNCDVCYCPADVGCVNNLSPMTISFSPFGTPSTLPFLNLMAVGTLDAGRGCGAPFGNGFNLPYGGWGGGAPAIGWNGNGAGLPAGPIG